MSQNSTHKLTDAEQAMLSDIQRDIANLQQQMQGALRLMLKTRGLEGNWTLNGNELVKAG
jgi:hypothetical protein